MKKNVVSVIIPVYNCENYLDDCITSIIKQSYGFKNIELILVNDGSTDNSLKICKKYKNKYNNIIVINKNNTGVSDSRNIGLEKSNGKYILFLDSDDFMSNNSIKVLSDFLDKNSNVDFVISRVRMFESTNRWHYLDFRFNDNNKFIDIDKDIKYCQYHSTGILFRKSILNDIRFDKNIKYGEDMKFMSEIILKNSIFGKEKKSILFYRKRFNKTSAVQKQFQDKSYYINTVEKSYKYIFDIVRKKYGYITKYFQYYILNNLIERFDNDYYDILNKKELEQNAKNIKYLIDNIDDDIIMLNERVNFNYKYYFLKLKHGENYNISIDYNNKIIFNEKTYSFNNYEFVKVLNVEESNDKVKIYISINDYLFPNNIKAFVNEKEVKLKEVNNIKSTKYYDTYFNSFYKEKVYDVELESLKKQVISFKIGNRNICYDLYGDFKSNSFLKCKRIKKNVLYFYKEQIVFKKYNFVNYCKFIFKKIIGSFKREDYYTIVFKNGKIKKKQIILNHYNNINN